MTRDATGRAVQMPLAPPAGAVPAGAAGAQSGGFFPPGLPGTSKASGPQKDGRLRPTLPLRAGPLPGIAHAPALTRACGHGPHTGRQPRLHTDPGLYPPGTAGSLPALVGHCWTDTGGKKQEKACLGEKQPPWPTGRAPLLCAQPSPQGTDSNLGGPRAQLSAARGRSWSLSDSGWLCARSGLGLAGGSGCCTDMVLRRWLRFRRNSGWACSPKLPLRRIMRELFFLGRERWPASSAARWAA